MQTFEKQAAQGDVLFTRIEDDWTPPENAELVTPENGKVIVAHSETGHCHVMEKPSNVTMYRLPDSIYDCFLQVKEATPLVHERPYDTHESIMFKPGNYHVKRQREYTPEGYRRVAD